MKKIIFAILFTLLLAFNMGCALPSDGNDIEPRVVWEEALVEYLEQFLPIFHNVRYEETVWRAWQLDVSGWESDWSDFIEWYDGYWSLLENTGYGYTYFYRNPITGERLAVDDVPYLNQRSGTWYDNNGESRTWSITKIATRFELFDFDGTGIPELLIYWNWPQDETAQSTTLHRFHNDTFEFVKDLSEWMWIGFYRADDDRIFIDYRSTVAHMLEMRLMYLNDEVTIKPALSTYGGWPAATLYNHLTGEYFLQYPDGSMQWKGLTTENRREEMLGMSLTRIEPMKTLQAQLIELTSARLRVNGLIL